MKLKELRKEIVIPEGIEARIEEKTLIVKGAKGENKRTFLYPRISVLIKDNKVILSALNATKKDKTMMGTFNAHVKNLIEGVKGGFTYKLKICSGHFPMTVSSNKNLVIISNFMGEKTPRKAKILPDVNFKVEGDIITLTGHDKDKVGQSAANIELATRRTGFDKRVFQDGCYIIQKPEREIRLR